VTVVERTNVRHLAPEDIGGRVDLCTADLSFISLSVCAPALARCTTDDADLVLLVKPQFEAGRAAVERGGIVRDAAARADAVVAVAERFADAGVGITAIAPSRLAGREGNREIFVHGRKGAAGLRGDDLRRSAERAAA
jgi:23S rRNA (cytidine1920-2'-O)/16S rRNA (cytidine1409-2'-O)-methyltransferase